MRYAAGVSGGIAMDRKTLQRRCLRRGAAARKFPDRQRAITPDTLY